METFETTYFNNVYTVTVQKDHKREGLLKATMYKNGKVFSNFFGKINQAKIQEFIANRVDDLNGWEADDNQDELMQVELRRIKLYGTVA